MHVKKGADVEKSLMVEETHHWLSKDDSFSDEEL